MATLADKIGLTELNEIILNSMPQSWTKKFYVQGFDCKYILFKKADNMFESTEITEGVVEPSYKKSTWVDANCAGRIGNKRGEDASHKTHPTTDEISGKRRKRYVNRSMSKSKTCLIHGPSHSSD